MPGWHVIASNLVKLPLIQTNCQGNGYSASILPFETGYNHFSSVKNSKPDIRPLNHIQSQTTSEISS